MMLPFPIPIFYLAAGAFAFFSLVYVAVAAAIIYHLRAFSISGRIAPHIAIVSFTIASIALWLLALFFLFRIPR
ncbi:MAG: hypothetical protein HY007_02390 [Candidatus Sungbacteria bacterium]|nr:hypothetical protein [Candidatus Sungbacteria bacterium]